MAATNDTPSVGDVLAGLPVPVKVYAVSRGDYSDYRVEVIFGARDDALAYAAAENGVTLEEMTWWQEQVVDGKRWSRTTRTKRYAAVRRKLEYDAATVEEFDFYPPRTS